MNKLKILLETRKMHSTGYERGEKSLRIKKFLF